MAEESDYPYWRRIWQITSGSLKNVTKNKVESTLAAHSKVIVQGILNYKKAETPKPIEGQSEWTEDLTRFVKRTADYLNVDLFVAWEILKSYLVNEYCGSIESIKKLKYEMQILPMLANIWKFYTSERMFMLKTLRTVLEFDEFEEHPYSDVYCQFLEGINLREVWDSLVEQFSYLISEIQGNLIDNNVSLLQNWIVRNNRELVEIIHLLIMFARYGKVQITDFHKIIVLCKSHGFGREPTYYSGESTPDGSSVNIRLAEIALLLTVANQLWEQEDDSWYEWIEDTYIEMLSLAYREEHGAVGFIWVALHLSVENILPDVLITRCMKIARRAMQLRGFNCFSQIIGHEMFNQEQTLIGETISTAMFNMIMSCSKAFGDSGMIEFPGFVDTLCEIARDKKTCTDYFDQLMLLWNDTFDYFPYKYTNISKVATALISAESPHSQLVLEELHKLPMITEIYKPLEIRHIKSVNNDMGIEMAHTAEYRTVKYPNYSFEIPFGSSALIRRSSQVPLIHYEVECVYWTAFVGDLNYLIDSDSHDSNLIEKVESGLKLVLAILTSGAGSPSEEYLWDTIKCMFALIDKFANVEMPSFKIVAVAIDIVTFMLKTKREYIISQMDMFNLIPAVANKDFVYEDIFHINFLEPGKIGNLIVSKDRYHDQHTVLLAYLRFLRSSLLHCTGDISVLELPGLVFILKEVFPHFMVWYSDSEVVYQEVLYQCIHLIFEIFQEDNISAAYCRMRKIAYQSFLNETCGRCLLRIISVGNSGIQYIMEGQTNWYNGRGIKYISVVQKAMAILTQLLTQRKTVIGDNGLTPLENMIYSENDTVKSVQAIASLMNNPFIEAIPNLACRLLKKLTVELQMSMLAALDLEPDQVRLMFVQRLRDHLECDDLKLAIIELISSCIPKQPGMTEAFFKVAGSSSSQASSSTNLRQVTFNEGIGSFLVEYLHMFSEKDIDFDSPLLPRIMELFHVLWINQKEILIADIVKDEQFWPSLCKPLFMNTVFTNKTYAEIFNILAKEIHKKSGTIDEHLKEVLQKLFNCDKMYLLKWIQYIYRDSEEEVDLNLSPDMSSSGMLVISWKDLLIISIKYLSDDTFTARTQVKLAEETRKSLLHKLYNSNDSCVMTLLVELNLFFLHSWPDACFKHDAELYEDVARLLQKVSVSYLEFPKRFQEAALAFVISSLRGINSLLVANTSATKLLIGYVGDIFNAEYNMFSEKYDQKAYEESSYNVKDHKTFIMCFEVLSELLASQNTPLDQMYNVALGNSQILNKLVICVKKFMENKSTLPLTKVAIGTLINYAMSENAPDFIQSDFYYVLWQNMQAKEEYRHPKYLEDLLEIVPWDLSEWWIIYKRFILLLTILLKKHKFLYVKEIIMFVSLHEDYITEVLLLERFTVDSVALDLIKYTLIFLYELLKYQQIWRNDHEQSLFSVLDAIKNTWNCCSAMVVRPNVFKFCTVKPTGILEEDIGTESTPPELLVDVMNKLTDIISLSTQCLLQFSPTLFRLLRDNTDYSEWPLLVQPSFGIPSFGIDDDFDITFGSLICVSSLYVRVGQQINNTRKSSTTTFLREILVPKKNRPSSNTNLDDYARGDYSTGSTPRDETLKAGNDFLRADNSQSKTSVGSTPRDDPHHSGTKMSMAPRDDPLNIGGRNLLSASNSVANMSIGSTPRDDMSIGSGPALGESASKMSIGSGPPLNLGGNSGSKMSIGSGPALGYNSGSKMSIGSGPALGESASKMSIGSGPPLNLGGNSGSKMSIGSGPALGESASKMSIGSGPSLNLVANSNSNMSIGSLPPLNLGDNSVSKMPGPSLNVVGNNLLSASNSVTNMSIGSTPREDSINVAGRDLLRKDSSVTRMSVASTTRESKFNFYASKRAGAKYSADAPKTFIKTDYLNPTLSSVQNFTFVSPAKNFSWFSQLNEESAYFALETVLTLLGSQVSLLLHHREIEERGKRILKRELYSELSTFFEFIKKMIVEKYVNPGSKRSIFTRNKAGTIEFDEDDHFEDDLSRRFAAKDSEDSFVTRGIPSKRSLDMSGITSLNCSPKSSRPAQRRHTSSNLSAINESKFSSQCNEVKLWKEDYLQFIFLWFSNYILQSTENE